MRLLEVMAEIATRRMIIFTPNGFLPQRSEGGDLEEHLSGWDVQEMRKLGFEVTGMYGYKRLRGEKQGLVHRPKLLWGLVSQATHYLWTRRCPELAAAIFCVKRVAGETGG